jgi:hypothetical protein
MRDRHDDTMRAAIAEGEREVRRQLCEWVLAYHPHEPRRRAQTLSRSLRGEAFVMALADAYGIDVEGAARITAFP